MSTESTDALDRLVISRVFPADPAQVWVAWTTTEGLRGWWWSTWPDVRYAIDARPGGSYRISADDHGIAVRGEYLAFEPTARLVFTWIWTDADGDGPAEQVEVSFAATDAGTEVTVVHTGPWTTADPAENYRLGWDFVLNALSTRFTGRSHIDRAW